MSQRPGRRPAPSAQPQSRTSGWPAEWIICVAIFVLTVVVYLPALSGGFIWDDSGHVTRPELRSLSGLFRIWFEFGATQQYYPVLHSAFWLEHLVWGDSTLCYHLFNVLLHASAACLFGTLLRRLKVPGAWLAALLFALHPVCVESVAWISEQKNTLSLVFYLCAALAYFRFTEQRRASAYLLATGLFVLALMTKTVTASLPAALLVVFWWQRGRLDWRRDVVPLLPWFLLGLVSGLVTAHFERELIGAQGAGFDLDVVQRCLLAGRVFWFYLGKLLWPADLIFIYPHWTVDASVWWQWLFLVAALALVAGLVGWNRRQRAPLATALIFGGSLFPVLGFFNVFPFLFSYVADHFQYLASLPVFSLAGAGLTQISLRLPRWGKVASATALLAVLGGLSWSQCDMYRDNLTLYQTILKQNPTSWFAHNNLATELTAAGRMEEAIPHLQTTLKLHPNYALAENNFGDALSRLNRPLEAIPHFEQAIRLEPRFSQAYYNLGYVFMAVDRLTASVPEFELALKYQPNYPAAELNLAVALSRLDRTPEAIPHFEKAVQLKPDYAEAEVSWAIALMLSNHFDQAIPHFEKAVSLQPNSEDIRDTYGRALMRAGRFEDSIPHFRHIIELDPKSARAHMNLAFALRQLGQTQEASTEYLEAVRLDPSLISTH